MCLKINMLIGFFAICALAGCSAPKHTNTLIFGTDTKVALDVSQDPTGALGITLGYKRKEAVWMPLLANETVDGKPAKCSDDACRRFVGKTGEGEPSGKDAEDTYSVLATFKGNGGGSASGAAGVGVKGNAELAQYFATGFAARILAEQGAAVVNTAASSKNDDKAAVAEVERIVKKIKSSTDKVISYVVSSGNVDQAKLGEILANDVSDKKKAYLLTLNEEQLRSYFYLNHEFVEKLAGKIEE